jgi:hypothetical protein
MVEYRRLLRQRWFDYGPKFVGCEWFRHGRRILDHKVSLGTLSRTSKNAVWTKFGPRLRLRQFKASCAVLVQQDAELEGIHDLCYLTIDLRTLPQAGPRDLLPQPKRTF